MLHRMAEDGRVSVRQARHAANELVKEGLRANETGEDEAHRLMAERTEAHRRVLSQGSTPLMAVKEKEVMAI